MKTRTTKRILLGVMVLLLLGISLGAVEYNSDGYYNAQIFVQNKLDEFYSEHFEFAVEAWNDAGVTDRSIVVNTVSTSEITNINFRGHPKYGLLNSEGGTGVYSDWSKAAHGCSCHSTTAFTIYINDFFARDKLAGEYLLTGNQIKNTIVHEFGHAFGLNDFEEDVYVYDSIMSYRVNSNTMYTPQTRDVRNANACWAPHRSN